MDEKDPPTPTTQQMTDYLASLRANTIPAAFAADGSGAPTAPINLWPPSAKYDG